jgi:AcrR family transcriptional regulator
MADHVKTRRPASPLRQAQAAATRSRIVASAHSVFERHGFDGARIEDIAAHAGVAVPTVYKAFGNKRKLLASAVSAAMAGGPDEALDRQAWFQEQLDASTGELQLRLIARNARRIYDRAGHLLEVVRAAAAHEDEIRGIWDSIARERLQRSRLSAKQLGSKATLRTSIAETARTLWALTGPELYVLQVDDARGANAYERWLADLLVAAIIAD